MLDFGEATGTQTSLSIKVQPKCKIAEMKSRIYCFFELSAKSISVLDICCRCCRRRPMRMWGIFAKNSDGAYIAVPPPRDKISKNFNGKQKPPPATTAIQKLLLVFLFHSFFLFSCELCPGCECVCCVKRHRRMNETTHKKVADDLCNFSFLTVTTFCIKRERKLHFRFVVYTFLLLLLLALAQSLSEPSIHPRLLTPHSINDCYLYFRTSVLSGDANMEQWVRTHAPKTQDVKSTCTQLPLTSRRERERENVERRKKSGHRHNAIRRFAILSWREH